MSPFSRRAALVAALAWATGACKRVARCSSCGMALDPASRWYAEVEARGQTLGFDTPKCALKHLLVHPPGQLFVRSYYQQRRVEGAGVVFAAGSDILGPMGEDLVPVEPEHEQKFRAEHGAKHLYKLDQLTLSIVEST